MKGPEPRAVRRLFDRIAGRYDLMNRVLSGGLLGEWRRQALQELEAGPEHLLLDACAGTGALGLASRAGRVICLDFSLPMLRVAARHNDGRLWLVCGDALRTPLPDACCDRAVVGFSLRNLADVPAFFAEMARVTRPRGRLVSLELTRPQEPRLARMHRLVVRWLVPLAGFLTQMGAYRHLAQTVLTFPPPEQVAGWMERAGWQQVRMVSLSGGIATLHIGTRP